MRTTSFWPLVVISLFVLLIVQVSRAAPATQPVLLWPDVAPGATGTTDEDKPAITAYLPDPDKNTGAAILVCPGGGYLTRCTDFEGTLVANWLKERGVAAFILRYRIRPIYGTKESLADAQRGMQYVRSHAQEYHISPDRIGIVGFSAGSDLAANTCIKTIAGNADAKEPIDRVSSRPDFLILAYGSAPVPTGTEDAPAPKLPPTFMFCTAEDTSHMSGMLNFYAALRRQRVPAEVHFFQSGEHGVGFAQGDPLLGEWPQLMLNWANANGLLTAKSRMPLRGIVKVDGEPLARGEVVFTPIDSPGAPVLVGYVFNTGPTRGEYALTKEHGPVAGRYRVQVVQVATRWMSNSVNPMQVKMQQKQRNGTMTEEDRKEWVDWARKRDLSPSLDTERIFSRQHPNNASDLIVDIKDNENRLDVEVFTH